MKRTLLIAALLAGLFLRLSFVQDMEYKEDEEYNFTQTQSVRGITDWPWVGMPSGVYLENPGMSVWVFIALAKITNATRPTELATAVQLFAILGITLLIPFAYYFFRSKKEREPWLWAFALAMVNPFAVFYQRKLWPEPFMPFFSMLMLMGWWRKDSKWGALVWGLIGAWLGQIHMSGFFLAGGIFLWTLLGDRKRTHWMGWLAGSVIGALPLIPWLLRVLQRPLGHSMTTGLSEMVQLKYWVFWITNPLGLHLGNPLGLTRGSSVYAQISDFIRYPIIGGTPTYLNGLAHLVVASLATWILARTVLSVFQSLRSGRSSSSLKDFFFPAQDPTRFAILAALIGCGLMLTATGVNIRRYYMMVTFPLEFVWLVLLIFRVHREETSRRILLSFWVSQLFISATFVGYVHVNEGAPHGDYGEAYHIIMKKRGQ